MTYRLESYSDGIFAVSATLLVVNFSIPILQSGSNEDLIHGLLGQWPKLLAFLLSFSVTMNYWRLHSAIFRGVRVVDHRTTMLNMLLLAAAAFVPYATNVAGAYPTQPAAAVLYSATLLVAAIAGLGLSHHLIASKAYGEPLPPVVLETRKRIVLAVLMRAVGLGVAFFFPIAAYTIYWLVIIYYIMSANVDEYQEERATS